AIGVAEDGGAIGWAKLGNSIAIGAVEANAVRKELIRHPHNERLPCVILTADSILFIVEHHKAITASEVVRIVLGIHKTSKEYVRLGPSCSHAHSFRAAVIIVCIAARVQGGIHLPVIGIKLVVTNTEATDFGDERIQIRHDQAWNSRPVRSAADHNISI